MQGKSEASLRLNHKARPGSCQFRPRAPRKSGCPCLWHLPCGVSGLDASLVNRARRRYRSHDGCPLAGECSTPFRGAPRCSARAFRHFLLERWELRSNTRVAPQPGSDGVMDPSRMVKEYSRSSADQEEPLPHELRPPHVLRLTMDYLLVHVMDPPHPPPVGEWYDFIWNRTRSIRKVGSGLGPARCCRGRVSRGHRGRFVSPRGGRRDSRLGKATSASLVGAFAASPKMVFRRPPDDVVEASHRRWPQSCGGNGECCRRPICRGSLSGLEVDGSFGSRGLGRRDDSDACIRSYFLLGLLAPTASVATFGSATRQLL